MNKLDFIVKSPNFYEWLKVCDNGGGAPSPSPLPPEYKQVEYLESTGTQYIDLGSLAIDNYVQLSVDFSISDIINSTWIAGNGNSWYNYLKGLGMSTTELVKPDSDTVYDPDILQTDIKIKGTFKTNESYQNVYLFARSGMYGAAFGNSSCKIYEVNTRELNNSLEPIPNGEKHKFIPCIRIADSIPGFYDTASETFFTNDGTGDFIPGAVL